MILGSGQAACSLSSYVGRRSVVVADEAHAKAVRQRFEPSGLLTLRAGVHGSVDDRITQFRRLLSGVLIVRRWRAEWAGGRCCVPVRCEERAQAVELRPESLAGDA